MLVLVLARLVGDRAIYGVLLDAVGSPGTVLGVAAPLGGAAARRRFLAGDLPADPDCAAWGQRQRWVLPPTGPCGRHTGTCSRGSRGSSASALDPPTLDAR